jgi:hypothetical protein
VREDLTKKERIKAFRLSFGRAVTKDLYRRTTQLHRDDDIKFAPTPSHPPSSVDQWNAKIEKSKAFADEFTGLTSQQKDEWWASHMEIITW